MRSPFLALLPRTPVPRSRRSLSSCDFAFIFPAYARTVSILSRSYASFGETEARPNPVGSNRVEPGRARVCAIDTLDRTGASRRQRLREAGLLRGKSEREREVREGLSFLSRDYRRNTRLRFRFRITCVLFRPSRVSCVHIGAHPTTRYFRKSDHDVV